MTPEDIIARAADQRLHCTACGGTGKVLSALGELRPCSRCNDDYHEWARKHFRPEPAALASPGSSNGGEG